MVMGSIARAGGHAQVQNTAGLRTGMTRVGVVVCEMLRTVVPKMLRCRYYYICSAPQVGSASLLQAIDVSIWNPFVPFVSFIKQVN